MKANEQVLKFLKNTKLKWTLIDVNNIKILGNKFQLKGVHKMHKPQQGENRGLQETSMITVQ